jgi:Hemerythrin HHE cation binding domain
MMSVEPPADTRMMGIVHAAFSRDLARVRLVLTAAPAPQGSRRQAVADQVLWLMEMLHEHHQTEDDGLWPLIRRHNPAAAPLLATMEADHRAIVPAIGALTAAARHYRCTQDDAPRLELVAALDALTGVLLPHLDREVAEAMPVVGQTLTARQWDAWNKESNVKPKSLRELGLEGHWLLDEIDPEGYQVVTQQVPAVPRFILLHGFARPYRRRRDAWWSPGVSAGPVPTSR